MFSFIMFILLVVPIFSAKVKLPEIVGLIIAGIIVGPYGLGILRLEGAMGLFSSVGLIYIMFLAGLEINAHEFRRQRKYSILFGSLTFSIPMLLGIFGARALFNFSWPTAVLLASMFASHTLISFPITAGLGISRERSVVTTVGGTIITDTAAILVLAFIAEYATASLTTFFWARQIFLLAALLFFAWWILPRTAQLFLRILSPRGKTEFIFILALVFLTAYLAHLAGVEPIIGAFFAGLALSQMISEQSPLMNRLEFVGHTLFIPFFLVSVGMLVNLRALFSINAVWGIAVFMTICAISCKYAAGMLFARMVKFSRDEGRLIFGLSVNQAAATLAAVVVGLRLGIFNELILNGTIIMILATCMVGPWFTEKYAKRIALRHIKPPDHLQHGDERIMVGVSHDESGEYLTDVALKLRPVNSEEPLFPLHVVQDGSDLDRGVSAGEKILSRIVAQVVSANTPVTPISRIDVNIPGGILHALKEWHIDTLVMGVSRYASNFERILFGIYDKISEESRQLFFLCRMTHFLNIDKNIFFIILPTLELHIGFNRAFESVKNLAAGNKIQLHTIAAPATVAHIKKVFKKEIGMSAMSFAELSRWKEFFEYVKNLKLQESDAVVFLTARRGKLGWRSSFELLYRNLCREFPKNNVFLVHPSDSMEIHGEPETFDPGQIAKNIRNHPFLTRPAIDIEEPSPEAAVRALLKSHFGSESGKISELIRALQPFDPLELTPEILLFHTHLYNLEKPVVLLGINHGDFSFPPLKKKSRAFFVLVSPKDQTELHLQMLVKVAKIAKEFK